MPAVARSRWRPVHHFRERTHRVRRALRVTLAQAPLHPREIVKAALAHNAAAIIMAHNHPSGNPEPSGADVTATGEVKTALQLVGVTLLDHLIVAGNAITSLAERHLMP
uniref:JAB domain-containing protein n=1 Tax=Bordetella genomosp. 9 TaxID=1416803 RepID=UPI003592F4B1